MTTRLLPTGRWCDGHLPTENYPREMRIRERCRRRLVDLPRLVLVPLLPSAPLRRRRRRGARLWLMRTTGTMTLSLATCPRRRLHLMTTAHHSRTGPGVV